MVGVGVGVRVWIGIWIGVRVRIRVEVGLGVRLLEASTTPVQSRSDARYASVRFVDTGFCLLRTSRPFSLKT